MGELERFRPRRRFAAHSGKAALAHVQFETIHPFLDGNGRVGRLLIALMLHDSGVLRQPLLYLSLYFKQHRAEYYRLLDSVRRDGDWEAWLDFFLEGVAARQLPRSRLRIGCSLYSEATSNALPPRDAMPRARSASMAHCARDRSRRFRILVPERD